ncbi:MBL fold metallo-hydrolase [Elongatibacter sediminis]|uniref:MBL fold metallo-hydrolase n=1 Tax=Elongatibacter sediminis TaxID=3119006 RepID=A0AAW9RJJ1_9GAMM
MWTETTRLVAPISLLLSVLACSTAGAHDAAPDREPLSLDQMADALGIDPEAPVKVQELGDGFYVLFGLGGNVLVSSGEDGVLIIDDQFPMIMPRLRAAMKERGDTRIDFVVNTHWHFDHADGNQILGAEGTWLVSQANSRRMLLEDQLINLGPMTFRQEAYPPHALPDITFDTTMQFHFNGERIDLLHVGPAHTTGDAAVYFHGHDTVHMGDVFNLAGYPFVDAGNGGTLDGMLAFSESVLETIGPKTIVVPGHGPVADRAALVDYVAMLRHVHAHLTAMIAAGGTLEEALEAGITARWDEEKGDPASFIERSWTSLTHRYLGPGSAARPGTASSQQPKH